MKNNEIKNAITTIVSKYFSDVDRDMLDFIDLVEDLNMSSLSFISMVIDIESCFDITISDDKLSMDNFRNIDAIVKIVIDTKHAKN